MKSILAAFAIILLSSPANADFIDTEWQVSGFAGEAWYADTTEIVGKTQYFERGFAEGVFYTCDFEGQSASYTTYSSVDAFLENPEFETFNLVAENLRNAGDTIFVHRISCNGSGNPANRRVLYPFVTTDQRASAFYLFEGAIYILSAP